MSFAPEETRLERYVEKKTVFSLPLEVKKDYNNDQIK